MRPTPSDPFAAYREIDRSISDFDRREAELAERMRILQRRLQDRELASTPTDAAVIKHEIDALETQIKRIEPLFAEAKKYQKGLVNELGAMPAKIDKAVERALEKQSDKGPRVLELLQIKYRSDVEKQLGPKRKALEVRTREIARKIAAMDVELSLTKRRLEALKRIWQAKKNQASNPSDLESIPDTFRQIDHEHGQLERERSEFNRNEGKTGDKAKMRFQSDLVDKTNAVLKTAGFVDTAATIERVMKGINEIEGTERTFVEQVMRKHKLELGKAVSPQDAVRLLIIEGDLSPKLQTEIDQIAAVLGKEIDAEFELAVHWWNGHKSARVHVDKLHGLLDSKLKFRLRRAWREDLAAWIKRHLS